MSYTQWIVVNIALIAATVGASHAYCAERAKDFDKISATANQHAKSVLFKTVQARFKGAQRVVRATHFPHYRVVYGAGRLPLTHYLCGEIEGKGSRGSYVRNRPFYAAAVIDPITGDVEEGTTIVSLGEEDSREYRLFQSRYGEQCRERTQVVQTYTRPMNASKAARDLAVSQQPTIGRLSYATSITRARTGQ